MFKIGFVTWIRCYEIELTCVHFTLSELERDTYDERALQRLASPGPIIGYAVRLKGT